MIDCLVLASSRVIRLCTQYSQVSLDISLEKKHSTVVLSALYWWLLCWRSESDLWKSTTTSFANALDKYPSFYASIICPCMITDQHIATIPSFVGNDSFCETGVPPDQCIAIGTFMLLIPCGMVEVACGLTSTCCTFNNPPWFYKQLPQSTNADLEVRLHVLM